MYNFVMTGEIAENSVNGDQSGKMVDLSNKSSMLQNSDKPSSSKPSTSKGSKKNASGKQPTISSMFSKAGNSSKSSTQNNHVATAEQPPPPPLIEPPSNNNNCPNVKEETSDSEPENELKRKSDEKPTNGTDEGLEPVDKKIKREEDEVEVVDRESSTRATPRPGELKRCDICRQILGGPNTCIYSGHPNEAVEEFVALTNPKLSLFTGDEESFNENDERPQNKLTAFSVYDKEGHLCPLDSGLIEDNVLLFASGYMKPVYEENPDPEDGVPAMDIGPINEWWVSGFDGGEAALIGLSTAYGEYYLMEPSEEYAGFMTPMWEKIFMSKLVIEFLLDEIEPVYEDLLNKLHTAVPPKGLTALTEDSLLRHSQFICDQVQSVDSASTNSDMLITTPCMRTLMKLSGVTLGKRRAMRKTERKRKGDRKPEWTKATTTELVRNVFDTFFVDQIDNEDEKGKVGPRRRRCGVCEVCQMADCGECVSCKDMVKFGGTGRSKQCCVHRRCPNLAVQEADDSEAEDDEEGEIAVKATGKKWNPKEPVFEADANHPSEVRWIGEPIHSDNDFKYYSYVNVNGFEFGPNDCVLVKPNDPKAPSFVARVVSMGEDTKGSQKAHLQWFIRGSDTVLGETSDQREIFLVNVCEDVSFGLIMQVATVQYHKTPHNWHMLGGEPLPIDDLPDDGTSFFYQKMYDAGRGRFEDIKEDIVCPDTEESSIFCQCCEIQRLADVMKTPSASELMEEEESVQKEVKCGIAHFNGEEYRVGHGVYLRSDAFKFGSSLVRIKKEKREKVVDEDMYPEFYRKSSDHVKGSNEETCEPYCIGYISSILKKKSGEVTLNVNKMYRPENTHRGQTYGQQLDLNLLLWSDEELNINLSEVLGKCYIVCSDNLDEPEADWSSKGPHRFYFREAYDPKKQVFVEPSSKGLSAGMRGKGKSKGKGKGKSSSSTKWDLKPPEWPQISDQLRCLDVFAGCGGLSEGIHQSGIAKTLWAIEKDDSAANAFRLNNPETTVFSEDCNELLKLVMRGDKVTDKGQSLPQRGDVDLMCGGPPCQGFSGMNRFNSRQYSLFKNSLVASYLSYCDYYRPRFFILENVRNFVAFKRSIVLKLTLRCLIKMGYQCAFGVLQAGSYGVPQTRRRAIIIAAAPGEVLPEYPSALHTFNKRASQLSVVVDDKKFTPVRDMCEGAPLRTITVRDAMSDLPEISNGHCKDEMAYGGEALTHFQRRIRGNQYMPILRDHVCKKMAPLVEVRMANIPTAPGSDWRDLPNISVRLSDGKMTGKLLYTHHDKKNGESSNGSLRGVCSCAEGKPCDPMCRQFNTLIPWCLPHTGNRHNNWAGLYGRLEWDGFFSTTVTNPEPMGKQGRVLHPEQTRVVSVRECARSQGFPDTYRFFGNILDRHRQIGNAVPPPMGLCIGMEIRKCVSTKAEKCSKEHLENNL